MASRRSVSRSAGPNAPDFEATAADVVGPYLNLAQYGGAFSVDEKTAIQALDRKSPVPPLSPGRAEPHGCEYYRHGTLSLYVAFLTDLGANQPRGKEIHVIADKLSAHKSKQVDAFLIEPPRVHMHFTPTCSSRLNQVKLWFAKIARDGIARGVFTSVADLKRKLMRHVCQYNEQAKPEKWKFFDPTRRITADRIVTPH